MYQTCFRVVVFLSFFFTTNLLSNYFPFIKWGKSLKVSSNLLNATNLVVRPVFSLSSSQDMILSQSSFHTIMLLSRVTVGNCLFYTKMWAMGLTGCLKEKGY